MFRHFILNMLLTSACLCAQEIDYAGFHQFGFDSDPISQVEGTIRNYGALGMGVAAVLYDSTGSKILQETDVRGDGTFQFRHVPEGQYIVRLVHQPAEVLSQEALIVGPSGGTIEIDAPVRAKQAPAGTISVEQLRHPLTSKGAKILKKAQDLAATGDHLKAIEALRSALSESSAAPYAHSMLGVEYLKTGQVQAAKGELEEAVQLLPENSVNHSNLGYALYLEGDQNRSVQEIQRALEIDRNNSPAQKMLNLMLHAK